MYSEETTSGCLATLYKVSKWCICGYNSRLWSVIALPFYISQQKQKSRGVPLTVSINPFPCGLDNKVSLKPDESQLYTVVRQFHGGFLCPGLGPWGELYAGVGNCSPAKFPDSSRKPAAQAGLPNDSSLKPCCVTSSVQVGSCLFSLFPTTLG